MQLKRVFLALICLLFSGVFYSQVEGIHPISNAYQKPIDPLVLQKLEKWQDQKFGIIIHWGLYAVPGMIESWSICSEDWITRDTNSSYDEYKKWYFGLKDSLNPTKFNPEKWAEVSKKAGMKYLVFTTKHHDGFCMFDTKQTDFSIANGPFAINPKADVLKYVLEAYRKEGFMLGAYFSKPDWHNENYWWPMYATPNRNNNYDTRKHPWRWKQFQDYSYLQIQELVSNYKNIDILWLDGGWIRPKNTIDEEVLSWGAPIPEWKQELPMDSIVNMARAHQPGLIVVDRTVQGPYENYQTPEHTIPEKRIDNPWETCMPLGNDWGYVPNNNWKSVDRVIRTLVEVVAKGGNLLLGIGPKADGTFPAEVEEKLLEVGKWLDVNGESIYGTRSMEHYQDRYSFFTRSKDNKTAYILVSNDLLLTKLEWTINLPQKGSKLIFLPTGESIPYKIVNGLVEVNLSRKLLLAQKNNPVWVFKFELATE
jgi:alpha-L-fucosidase